jgi:ribosomal protein L12E/L44/L45/RPP1/RPP2
MRRTVRTEHADGPITEDSGVVVAADAVGAAAGSPVEADTLSRAVDALAIAVDRLFVTELRRGLADDDTLDLVATARELAAATTATPATRATPAHGRAHAACEAGPGDPEGTCSG